MIIDEFTIGDARIVLNQSIQPIHKYTQKLGANIPPICVDIGANDGLNQSNSLFLYLGGWSGVSLDADAAAMARLRTFYGQYLSQVQTACIKVTPDNVTGLLKQAQITEQFGFLSLDIDSFDYDVLKALLETYRPAIICAEINEKIPPPIFFKLNYDPQHTYAGDHFYGMSLSALSVLAERYEYEILELCFNNLILITKELNEWPALTPTQAYQNYIQGPKPPWNKNVAEVLSLSPEKGVAFLKNHFSNYDSELFELYLYPSE